jgi:transposase-like protein
MELRTFTDEEKIKILKYANKYGMTSAMRKYNVDVATQRAWNKKFNIYKKTGRRTKATYKKKHKHYDTEYKMEVLLFTKQYGISKAVRKYNLPTSTIKSWNAELKVYTPRKHRTFTESKKTEIIQFAAATSVAEAAKKYNLSSGYINNWIKDVKQNQK